MKTLRNSGSPWILWLGMDRGAGEWWREHYVPIKEIEKGVFLFPFKKHQWVRWCSLIGNEIRASFQRVTKMLSVNLVAFDVSTAEKVPSVEQVWKRYLQKASLIPLCCIFDVQKGFILKNKTSLLSFSPRALFHVSLLGHDPGEHMTNNNRVFYYPSFHDPSLHRQQVAEKGKSHHNTKMFTNEHTISNITLDSNTCQLQKPIWNYDFKTNQLLRSIENVLKDTEFFRKSIKVIWKKCSKYQQSLWQMTNWPS